MLGMNELTHQVQSDLQFYQKPSGMSIDMYLDQLLYSAMSEWIRTICFDTDPMLGSNKTGVTRVYLEDRAAEVLQDLAQAFFGCKLMAPDAKSAVHWMVQQMLTIGELWEPYPGSVMCMSAHQDFYWHGHARIVGVRMPLVNWIQVGLCHYTKDKSDDVTCNSFAQKRLSTERILVSYNGVAASMGRMDSECMQELRNKYKGRTEYQQFVADIRLQDAPAYLQHFLLTRGWPVADSPVQWEFAGKWMIRQL